MAAPDRTEPLDRAVGLLAEARRALVVTGAGISTESGIRDFRGPDGLWTKDPGAERRANIAVYMSEPEVRRQSWRNRLDSPHAGAEPNEGHRALVELERHGVLDTLVTQNVDGLHVAAGHDPSKVVEIHGTSRQARCMSCGHRQPIEAVLDRVRAGEDDPTCREPGRNGTCGGILKPSTISFGQSLVPDDLARAEAAARRCDLVLAVGSTLSVYPAAGLVPLAGANGAAVVIVNGDATDMDALADAVVRGRIGEVLPVLVRDALAAAPDKP